MPKLYSLGMIRFPLKLSADEYRAIAKLAERERRHPADQTVIVLREYLIERGLLPSPSPPSPPAPAPPPAKDEPR